MITIAGRHIHQESDCFVIAEIGHNHQGSIETCKELFRAAKDAGADAVKLQKRNNQTLYTKAFFDSPYSSENAYGPTYGLHREALEFNAKQFRELKVYAEGLGLIFFATAFDPESADLLYDLGMPCFKIASGDITNTPLLRRVAGFKKPVIMSTGAATLDDVTRAVETVLAVHKELVLLQCTAAYPTEPREINLRVIETYRRLFPNVIVGLSDHYNGIAIPVAAYVLGARVIEKHFTLNRVMRGTDHIFSLEPIGLKKMVRDLHRTREALGDGSKTVYDSEKGARVKMSKKIVAARLLPKGHVVKEGDLLFKSPGDGLPPYYAESLFGKRLCADIAPDQALTLKDFESVSS